VHFRGIEREQVSTFVSGLAACAARREDSPGQTGHRQEGQRKEHVAASATGCTIQDLTPQRIKT